MIKKLYRVTITLKQFEKLNHISYIENKTHYIKLRSDGIVHLHFKADEKISLNKYKQVIKEIGVMLNYKKAPFLISKDPFVILNKEISNFISTEEGAPYSIADAILTDGLGFTLLANFHIRINKPKRPTKIFANESDAVNWLKKVAQY